MTDPFKELELMGQESRESGEQWATGPAGRSVLDQIIQSDPAKHDIRITDVADRTRRVPAIAASVVLVVLIAGGAAFIRARDGGDLVDADRTSEPDRGVGVGPSGLTSDLPVGAEDSPYWVAHELPDGYALLDASMRSDPVVGDPGVPAPATGYGRGGNNRYDTDLWVTTVQWEAPDALWDQARSQMGDSFRSVTVRGKEGFEYPLSGDGRTYGTTLLWEERPGLWIQIEAAEPLTSSDAYAVADGLRPFPEEKWDLLVTSVDQNWYLEPDQLQAATKVGVTRAAESTGWALDALVPPRWGELPIDRRWPCARLTVDGAAAASPACDHPAWYVFGGQVFVVGMAPDEATSVKVRAGDAVVDAELHSVEPTSGFQFWVAKMGGIGCSEYQAEIEPAGLDDQLSRYMTGQNGPTEGCDGDSDTLVPGIDPGAPAPTVDELWDAHFEAVSCLEADGFGIVGPVPASDGSHLLYLVSSPPGGPVLGGSNRCEDPLKTPVLAFQRSAPPEARTALARQFREAQACLGLSPEPLTPDEIATGNISRDIEAEQQVLTVLMESESDNVRCGGRR